PLLEPQALERNADLDLVSPRRHVPARLINEIGAQVRLLPSHYRTADETAGAGVGALDDRPVALHAERVDREHQRLAAVMEGAEQDLHVVVAEDAVAVRQRRGRDAMLL